MLAVAKTSGAALERRGKARKKQRLRKPDLLARKEARKKTT